MKVFWNPIHIELLKQSFDLTIVLAAFLSGIRRVFNLTKILEIT